MAFPFARMPSLDEFTGGAIDQGCTRIDFPAGLEGPRGVVNPKCLQGPNGARVILPDMAADECLTPTVLRGLCRRLGLSLEFFDTDPTIN